MLGLLKLRSPYGFKVEDETGQIDCIAVALFKRRGGIWPEPEEVADILDLPLSRVRAHYRHWQRSSTLAEQGRNLYTPTQDSQA